jgi:tight adherence protein B
MNVTFLGALCAGVCAFLFVGLLTGNAPRLRRQRKNKPQTKNQQVWLNQAGLDLTPRQFWTASATLGAIGFTFFLVLTNSVAIALVPAISIAFMPRAVFARRRVQRLQKLLEAWPDTIREIVGAVQANISLHGALVSIAESGPEPLRQCFSRFPTLSATLGVVPALEIIREEMADPTSDRVIEVLILAHERGGAILKDILRDLATSTTKDIHVAAEIETNALEQKINSRAVFVLPWLILVFLTMQEGPFRDFYKTPGGLITVIIGGMMSLAGMFWVSRLGKDPVESRVFGGSSYSQVEVAP